MKLHHNLALAVFGGLKEIFLQQKQADTTVGNILQSNKTWGARDRNFIADNIYHIVRYKRLFEYCINDELFGEVSIWKLIGAKLFLETGSLPEWKEFATLDTTALAARAEEAKSIRKIRESVPDWLDEFGVKQLGADWEAEIAALNTPAKLCIRINTLKTARHTIKELFKNQGIEFSEIDSAPDALILSSRKNFKTHEAYKNGLFEVQDISSQLVARFLEPAPRMMVIDGCCGAGGKTLHIAALMENRGEILAVDVHEKKLEELERRAVRAGCRIVKPFISLELTKHKQALLQSTADRILLDVPCSGSGVLRRKPDAKWTLTKKFIDELQIVQAQILDEYAPMLKPGGLLVYSTCSIFPCENQEQVKEFLKRNMAYELVEEKSVSPATSCFDGFYMAKLKRK